MCVLFVSRWRLRFCDRGEFKSNFQIFNLILSSRSGANDDREHIFFKLDTAQELYFLKNLILWKFTGFLGWRSGNFLDLAYRNLFRYWFCKYQERFSENQTYLACSQKESFWRFYHSFILNRLRQTMKIKTVKVGFSFVSKNFFGSYELNHVPCQMIHFK